MAHCHLKFILNNNPLYRSFKQMAQRDPDGKTFLYILYLVPWSINKQRFSAVNAGKLESSRQGDHVVFDSEELMNLMDAGC